MKHEMDVAGGFRSNNFGEKNFDQNRIVVRGSGLVQLTKGRSMSHYTIAALFQNGANPGFGMRFAIGSHHYRCWVQRFQPKTPRICIK